MRTLLKIIARRWIVVIPTVILVLAVGVSAAQKASVKYEATGATLLLAPNNVFDPGNPYAEANPALNTTATALQRVLGTPVVTEELENEGLSTDFTVSLDEKAPIMTIKATADSPELAISSVEGVQAQIEKQLTLKEDAVGAGPLARIGSDRIVVPNKANKLLDDRNRAIVVMIVLGLLAVCGVALLADSFARRRDSRRSKDRTKSVVPGPVAPAAAHVVVPTPVAVPLPPAAPPVETPAPAPGPVRPAGATRPVTSSRRRSLHPRMPKRVAFTDPVWPDDWPNELVADGFDPEAFTTPTSPPEIESPPVPASSVIEVTVTDPAPPPPPPALEVTPPIEVNRPAQVKPRRPAHLASPAAGDSAGASWIDSVAGALESFSRRSGGRRRTPRRTGGLDGGPSGAPPREP